MQSYHAGQDMPCKTEGGGALSLFLPFTASDVLPKGSARGRISGSRSAVSGDLSPSISFSGLSGKRRREGNREKSKRKKTNTRKDNINQVLSLVVHSPVCQPQKRASAQFCVTLSVRDIRGQLFTSWPWSSKTAEDTLTHRALLSLRSRCEITHSSFSPTQSTKA